jgi:uncharacterized RmlC-like cupin family protein
MHLLTVPPGVAARPHLHEQHETAIYVLSGRAEMRYGEGLRGSRGGNRRGLRKT